MYKVKLIDKKEVAAGTMAFFFTKPAGYTFVAGQHTDLSEVNPVETDTEGASRVFCYASSPQEEFLMFATRMRNTAYKNSLKVMAIGTEVEIGGPRGSLVFPINSDRPVVFLAGGIGITPFRSIILDAAYRKLPHSIYLFYSNRTPEETAFLDELQTVDNPNFKLIPVFTKNSLSNQSKSKIIGETETRHVDIEMLRKYISETEFLDCVYFVVGPPQFVLAMKDLLVSSGVDDTSIRSEDFDGY